MLFIPLNKLGCFSAVENIPSTQKWSMLPEIESQVPVVLYFKYIWVRVSTWSRPYSWTFFEKWTSLFQDDVNNRPRGF